MLLAYVISSCAAPEVTVKVKDILFAALNVSRDRTKSPVPAGVKTDK